MHNFFNSLSYNELHYIAHKTDVKLKIDINLLFSKIYNIFHAKPLLTLASKLVLLVPVAELIMMQAVSIAPTCIRMCQ
jgi:hypothetical protein